MTRNPPPSQARAGFSFKSLIYGVIFVALLVSGAYTAGWYWYAGKLENEMASALTDFDKQGIEFKNTPRITGFPLLHKISYRGNVTTPAALFKVPDLQISGITFPQTPVTINFAKGLTWKGQDQISSYTLDELFLKIGLPPKMPDDLTARNMREWNKQDPKLNIYKFRLVKTPLVVTAQGRFKLDSDLQPAGEIVIKSRGHNDLIDELKSQGALGNNDTSFIQNAFSGFTKENENGEKFLHLALEIKDSFLYFGPLRIAPVPPLKWEKPSSETK